MRYFIALRSLYLMAYYFVLGKHPSKSYTLSVVIASTSGSMLSFFIMFLLVFGSKNTKTRFPFESLLFHGLSYEEWRTAKAVKERMDKIQTTTKGVENLPEDFYLILLLVLSFSGIIEHGPEMPQKEHRVNEKNAEMSTSIKNDSYQGMTLSRLVYHGVRITFLRKKLGPKRPVRTEAFMRALGIATN